MTRGAMHSSLVLAAFMTAVLDGSAFAADPASAENGAETPTKPRVLVTISKETTFITEPLRPDGYPDYLAALNQRCSRGVTPENNAAVLFWKAMGPGAIKKEYREKYFQMLGIPPLAEKGDYFVTLHGFFPQAEDDKELRASVPEANTAYDRSKWLTPALKQPWTERQHPALAKWLAVNEKPLALIVDASKRPRRFDPLIGGKKLGLHVALQPALSACRSTGSVADALVARAMLRLGSDRPDDAWEDLLACYRLARLFHQGPTLLDAFVAGSLNESASRGVQALLQSPRLTAAKIAKMRDDFNGLAPMPKLGDLIDLAERFLFLESVLITVKDKPASPAAIANSLRILKGLGSNAQELASMKLSLESAGDPTIDWDTSLRLGNAYYDELVSLMRQPAGAKRRKAVEAFEERTAALLKRAFTEEPSDAARETRSRRVALAFLCSFRGESLTTLSFDDRSTMRNELTKLAFALALYRAGHGEYPVKLAEIVPQYVAELPKDVFNNDADLHYTRKDGSYLLYSVGINGRDDGGRTCEGQKADSDKFDDIAVNMPAAKK